MWEEHGWSPDQFAAAIKHVDMMTPVSNFATVSDCFLGRWLLIYHF
jgi:hypothetical protein